jgi:type II secretion system protein G
MIHRATNCDQIAAAMLLISGIGVSGYEDPMTLTRTHLSNFGVALDACEVDVGRYPSTTEGLTALFTCPPGIPEGVWRGPYMKGDLPLDPWGHAYGYRCPGIHNTNAYDIYSCGMDGITKSNGGDPDDINNWDAQSPRSIKYRLPHGARVIALLIGAAIGLVASPLSLIWRPPAPVGNGHGVFALFWMSAYVLAPITFPIFLPQVLTLMTSSAFDQPQRLPDQLFIIFVLAGWIPGLMTAVSGLRKGYFISRVFACLSLILLTVFGLGILMPCYSY